MIDANHPVRIVNQVIEQIDSHKVTESINKIHAALKDKPVNKKINQKLKYAARNWPDKLDQYDKQEKILEGFRRFMLTGCDKVEIEVGLLVSLVI
ncbi:MAG: hypothetical protein Q8M08_14760 [Bacteroidales bacterium]|nr:hypothetical protein [Bacteroidales bacterium]